MIYARYELVLRGPVDTDEASTEAILGLPPLLAECEENITLLLPQGFSVTIEKREEPNE